MFCRHVAGARAGVGVGDCGPALRGQECQLPAQQLMRTQTACWRPASECCSCQARCCNPVDARAPPTLFSHSPHTRVCVAGCGLTACHHLAGAAAVDAQQPGKCLCYDASVAAAAVLLVVSASLCMQASTCVAWGMSLALLPLSWTMEQQYPCLPARPPYLRRNPGLC